MRREPVKVIAGKQMCRMLEQRRWTRTASTAVISPARFGRKPMMSFALLTREASILGKSPTSLQPSARPSLRQSVSPSLQNRLMA
jgi:hypothetical protein